MMNEQTETGIEVLTDLSCLACLEHMGLSSMSMTLLVIGLSTLARYTVDSLRIRAKRIALEKETKKDN